MKVAVVWNNDQGGVVNRFGPASPERYGRAAVENVVGALRERGHEALLCEGDKALLATLERFMPPDEVGRPGGMVFNMAYGIQGECRYAHVPAMLEMAGIPYTGSSPLGHALALDKAAAKRLIRDSGVPTPEFRVMRDGTEDARGLRFPVVAKPLHGSMGLGVQRIADAAALQAAVRAIVAQHEQDALVEEYVDGREICVSLLGNGNAEVLPFVEYDFGGQEEPARVCPARVDARLGRNLREVALATFRACRCRDYGRVDIRVDRMGRPWVLEINSMVALGVNAPYALAAKASGLSFPGLVERILDAAHRRYFGSGLAPEDPIPVTPASA